MRSAGLFQAFKAPPELALPGIWRIPVKGIASDIRRMRAPSSSMQDLPDEEAGSHSLLHHAMTIGTPDLTGPAAAVQIQASTTELETAAAALFSRLSRQIDATTSTSQQSDSRFGLLCLPS